MGTGSFDELWGSRQLPQGGAVAMLNLCISLLHTNAEGQAKLRPQCLTSSM